MAHQLRALATLEKVPGSVLHTHIELITVCNSSSIGSITLF